MSINLISDTITKPGPKMRQIMSQAEVGDDVFREDPTVIKLENHLAAMFNKEAGLFCPSGTMTNQIGIKINTQPLDEMICDISSHVYQYETAGYAFNSGIAVNLLHGKYGKITPHMIEKAIKPRHDWLPISKLVVVENSTNRGGGNYYTLDEQIKIHNTCRLHNLKLHLDGARLFNVLVETGDNPAVIGPLYDTISICLSKGLGAPAGSVLLGSKEDIQNARRIRKVMGGGMRQVGILASAGLYALVNNIDRLKDDNERARKIGDVLTSLNYIDYVHPVKTNIVIFKLKDIQATSFVDKLASHGVIASAFGEMKVRFVTHMDFDESMLIKLLEILKGIE